MDSLDVLIILLVLVLFVLFSRAIISGQFIKNTESFDNFKLKEDNDDLYVSLQDKVFNENSIYENDIKMFNKYAQLDNWTKPNILDAGTGFGRHYKCIKGYDCTGVDKEELYLKRAKIRNPLGTFKHGRLEDSELFPPETFTHIICSMDTLYNNRPQSEMNQIISNFHYWLKKGGVIMTHIFEKIDKVDPSPREYSMSYKDKKDNIHALTYFENFTHDAYFKKGEDYKQTYVEKYIVKSGNMIQRFRDFFFIPKEKMMKKFIDNNFELFHIQSLKKLDIDDYSLYFLKKKNDT